jgi:hypothetical protein
MADVTLTLTFNPAPASTSVQAFSGFARAYGYAIGLADDRVEQAHSYAGSETLVTFPATKKRDIKRLRSYGWNYRAGSLLSAFFASDFEDGYEQALRERGLIADKGD